MTAKRTPIDTQAQIEAAITRVETAYQEQHTRLIAENVAHPEIRQEPKEAWCAALPPLTNRINTQAFIACIAVGMARQRLPAERAKALLYTAQLALAAMSGSHHVSD